MLKRIISGAIIIALLVGLLYLGGVYLMVAIALLGIASEYEMVKTVKLKGKKLMEAPIYILSAALFPAYYYMGVMGILMCYVLTVMAFVVIRVLCDKYDYESIVYSMLCIIYPQIFYAFAYIIVAIPDYSTVLMMILISILSASGSDTMAYFTGKALGKHKLCEKISPNKTVEGAIGGLVGGGLFAAIYLIFFNTTTIPTIALIGLAVVLAALSQFGDLASSLTKRYFGVKDFGNLIPGHGGVLDRMCSIIFVLPVTCLFFYFFM